MKMAKSQHVRLGTSFNRPEKFLENGGTIFDRKFP